MTDVRRLSEEKASTGFLAFYVVKVFLDSALWMLEKQFTGLIEVGDKAGQDLQELFSSGEEGQEEVYQAASDLLKEPVTSAAAYTSSVKQASDILDDLFKACDVASYAAGSLEASLATCQNKSSEMKDELPKLMRTFLDTLADNIAWVVYNKDALKAYASKHLDYTVGIVQRVCTSVHGAVLALADGASSYAERVWTPCRVESDDGQTLSLISEDGEALAWPVKDADSLEPVQDCQLDGDVCTLPAVSEAALLHTLRVRYFRQEIYTRVARILISVNPFHPLPIYGKEWLLRYQEARDSRELPPHIYGIGHDALQGLSSGYKDQAIVISGESGAGKTESAKFLLNFIAESVKGHSAEVGAAGLEAEVVRTNPILEAFGNASTTRRDPGVVAEGVVARAAVVEDVLLGNGDVEKQVVAEDLVVEDGDDNMIVAGDVHGAIVYKRARRKDVVVHDVDVKDVAINTSDVEDGVTGDVDVEAVVGEHNDVEDLVVDTVVVERVAVSDVDVEDVLVDDVGEEDVVVDNVVVE
eukprot:s4195_g1.t1